MSTSIFISHARGNRAAAQAICDALERRGFQCWIADRDIRAGDNFAAAIVQAMRMATAMVLLISADADSAPEVKREVALAEQIRLTVVPARTEDVVPHPNFAYAVATEQWIDLFEDWDGGIERLARQLETVTKINPQEPVGASSPILGVFREERLFSPEAAPPHGASPRELSVFEMFERHRTAVRQRAEVGTRRVWEAEAVSLPMQEQATTMTSPQPVPAPSPPQMAFPHASAAGSRMLKFLAVGGAIVGALALAAIWLAMRARGAPPPALGSLPRSAIDGQWSPETLLAAVSGLGATSGRRRPASDIVDVSAFAPVSAPVDQEVLVQVPAHPGRRG
jgi:hypothetical protein